MRGLSSKAVPILAGVLLAAVTLCAQSQGVEDLATGKLLVAPRDAPDSNFAESVILLLHYDDQSALGLMINRRTTVTIARALHELKGAHDRSDVVYFGGPVEQEGVMALLRSSSKPENATALFEDVFVIGARQGLEGVLSSGKSAGRLRVYLGYCGWGPGQLDNEVRLGGWYIFDATANLVFDANPDTVWSRLIGRIEYQMAALRPRDKRRAAIGLRP